MRLTRTQLREMLAQAKHTGDSETFSEVRLNLAAVLLHTVSTCPLRKLEEMLDSGVLVTDWAEYDSNARKLVIEKRENGRVLPTGEAGCP